MIEGMRVVVAYTHLPTLRDIPMSAKYCPIAAAYSKCCSQECAIGKRSSQYACITDGTAWRASPWARQVELSWRGSKWRR